MATVVKTIGAGKDYADPVAWAADLGNAVVYSAGDDAVGLADADEYVGDVTITNTLGLASITLQPAASNGHDWDADSGVRIVGELSDGGLSGVTFEGLVVGDLSVNAVQDGIDISGGSAARQCVVRNVNASSQAFRNQVGIKANNNDSVVDECVVFNIANIAGRGVGITCFSDTDVRNCTVYNVAGSTGYGIQNGDLTNCLVLETSGNCIETANTTTTCGTSDTTGSTGLTNLVAADVFESLSPFGPTLKLGSAAIDAGTNVGFGDDVGAVQFVVSGSPSGFGRVDGVGSITGQGISSNSGSGEVQGVGDLAGSGFAPVLDQQSGFGAIVGVGSLDGSGVSTRIGSGAVNAIGSLAGQGFAPAVEQSSGFGSVVGLGTVAGAGATERTGGGALHAIARLTGQGFAPVIGQQSGAGSIGSVASVTGSGLSARSAIGSIAAIGVLSAAGFAPTVESQSGFGQVVGIGQADGAGQTTRTGAGSINSVGAVTTPSETNSLLFQFFFYLAG